VSLPRGGFEGAGCTFDVFLGDIFSDYIAEVKRISDPKYHSICKSVSLQVPKIEQSAEKIVAATKHYLKGHPHQAYEEINETLKSVELGSLLTKVSAFDPLAPPVPYDHHLESTLHPVMYRMRSNFELAAVGALKRKDIFHIPFEHRVLVKNQRYSISGLPCLYLGSSTWICWEELNRPELNTCICSRFKFAEEVTILDFELPPENAWNIYTRVNNLREGINQPSRIDELAARYSDEFIISYILYWPLIAASSIRVDSRVGAFFPQYIIPQILLQWVTKEGKVDGIRYFSTHTQGTNHYVNLNYVFPTRDIKHSGHCSVLRKKIHLVNPVPWALLDLIKKDPLQPGPLPGVGTNRIGMVQLSGTTASPYYLTKFSDFENRLDDLDSKYGSGPVED
jgi:hypothetical protein